jgi:hypothetical protein
MTKTAYVMPMTTHRRNAWGPCESAMTFHEYAVSHRRDATMSGQWVNDSHFSSVMDGRAMREL